MKKQTHETNELATKLIEEILDIDQKDNSAIDNVIAWCYSFFFISFSLFMSLFKLLPTKIRKGCYTKCRLNKAIKHIHTYVYGNLPIVHM